MYSGTRWKGVVLILVLLATTFFTVEQSWALGWWRRQRNANCCRNSRYQTYYYCSKCCAYHCHTVCQPACNPCCASDASNSKSLDEIAKEIESLKKIIDEPLPIVSDMPAAVSDIFATIET